VTDITERKRAEEVLRKSEQKFRDLLEAAPDAIVGVDQEGVIALVNTQTEELFGYNRKELLGKPVEILLPERYRTGHMKHRINYFANPNVRVMSSSFDLYGRRKDGIEIAVEINLSPLETEEGILVMSIVRDISERKRVEGALRQSESFSKKVVESSLNGLYIYDLEKEKNVYINPQYAKLTGFMLEDLDALDSSQFFGLFHLDDRPRISAHIQKITQANDGDIHEIEYRFKTAGGDWIWCLSWDSVFERDEHGKVRQIIGTFLDITERKRAEEQREQLLSTIKEKNRELEQIVYITSHDLRSPLVNIQGFSKELLASCEDLNILLGNGKIAEDAQGQLGLILQEDIPEALQIIQTSTAKMDSLLKGLLKLSRLGSVALNIHKLNMNRLVSTIAKTFEFQVKEGGVVLDFKKLPACYGDETQINQVFANLIGNALRYLAPDRSGEIKVSGVMEKDQCIYCVQDNGVGILKEQQVKIFEIFHRLNPEETEGEGLGLTIVQKILERHQGRIWLESKPGAGSEFFVSLPSKKFEPLGFNHIQGERFAEDEAVGERRIQ
ncbi:PAS domain S-box protein, partial [bacterium]|nr:PAS domain S-box protein [bacterium]